MKKSTIPYCSFAILGFALLALVLVGAYLDAMDSLSILSLLSPSKLGLWFVLGSIVSLTVGMVGIICHYFKNHRKLLSALAILLIPPLTFFASLFAYSIIISNALWFPMRSEITQVTVVDTDPLVLCLNVKAITSRDTRIESALILNNNEIIAQVPSEEEWEGVWGQFTLAELPGGSEILLTLDFNTTLPSGDYLVRLTCWHNNQGSSPFTIP